MIRFRSVAGILLAVTALAWGQTPDNPHGDIRWDCLTCHTTASWQELKDPSDFRHDDTGFPLVGAHGAIDCASCHTSLEFARVGTACADCHTDVHKGEFGLDCASCHSPVTWENREDVFEIHAARGFPLVGVHAIADCQACHVNEQRNEFAGLDVTCFSCHQSDFQMSVNPSHPQARFGMQCESCHQPVSVTWEQTTWEHPAVFELRGSHRQADCIGCHVQNTFEGTAQECFACHAREYDATVDPDHSRFGFPTDCASCHDEVTWDRADFDHLAQSGFALNGAHAEALCVSCHVDNQTTGLPQTCIGCHETDFNTAPDPDHVAAGFSTECLDCHTETAWAPSSFDHNLTDFPLTGAHIPLDCASCHDDGFTGTATDCYSCHRQDYETTDDPDHVGSQFPTECEVCHNTSDWDDTDFDHNRTDFPLTGAHVSVDCESCHSEGYTNTATDCYSCHRTDYEMADDHLADNYPLECEICHNTSDWDDADFDHNLTNFPLTGAHAPLDCQSCHQEGYANTPTDCYSCHRTDYELVDDPDHVALMYPTDCEVCHTVEDWDDTSFDHNTTDFPLTGAHLPLDCQQCHSEGYTNTPTDCYSCHRTDYELVDDPDHVANNYPFECEVCHNTSDWDDTNFDHNNTDFPLTGAHIPLDCQLCHADGYTNTPTDCYSCHRTDYEMADDPDHVANNYPFECEVCHTTSDWDDANFDHNTTNFPLTGAHVALDCQLCHANGYTNTPTACVACHQSDYDNSVNPDHVAAGFNTACEVCHGTDVWDNSTWNHDNTGYPLQGAHIVVECQVCHASGYSGTPSTCFACHQSDYNNTTDPDHIAAGFPTECEVCHNPSDWENTTWDHDSQYFPIYSGEHRNEWSDCADCHVNPANFAVFECIFCHEHNQGDMDDEHRGVSGYVYQSTACLNCHPDGSERAFPGIPHKLDRVR